MGKPVIIGITGASGSGKSTLARQLAESLHKVGKKSLVLAQDNYYKNLPQLLASQKVETPQQLNFDLPSCIDLEKLASDLKLLKSGKAVENRQYDFIDGKVKSEGVIEPDGYEAIIVEGIFALQEEVRAEYDFTIFVDTNLELCAERRFKRDEAERNIPIEQNRAMWNTQVLPSFKEYVAPLQQYATVVSSDKQPIEINDARRRVLALATPSIVKQAASFFDDPNNQFNRLQDKTHMRSTYRFI